MADQIVVVLQHSLKPLKIVKWKVSEGNSISIGCVLLLYKVDGDNSRESNKFKSTKAGTVHRVVAQEGDVVKFGETLLELKSCIHPTVMKDMCAECGTDLRKDDLETTASVPMIHSVPELKVSLELAQKLGKADAERLLKDRKLVLLVDLDQTLIHTTNDNIPPNIKDVYHFQLYGPHSPWYHTRLRPGTHRFLTNMSSLFELHICTFGARNYAHMIAMFLDADSKLFSHRILSRDECFNSNSKTANLRALFPCGDNMVCIIDDREDVWSYASNLIHVKPYHFFQHTGDINAPPGLDKHEDDDKEGVDLTKVQNTNKPVKVNGCKDQMEIGEDVNNSNTKDEHVDIIETGDINEENTVRIWSDEDHGQSRIEEMSTIHEHSESTSEELSESKSEEVSESKNDELPKSESKRLSESKSEKLSESKSKELSENKSGKLADGKSEELPESKSEEIFKSKSEELSESKSEELSENINKEHSESKSEEAMLSNGTRENITRETRERSELSKAKGVNSTEDLIEIEDPDDYLLYLEEILTLIHGSFYEKYDQMEWTEVPDLKKVIPEVRSSVLKGARLVFSGLVPTHVKLEQSKAYQVARSLGAAVTQDLDGASTHLVAVRPGTAKVNVGRRKKTLKIVTPDWLWACAERWEHIEESLYPLSNKGSKNRHPPPHCSSPEHSANFGVAGETRKRTPSGRFMDTINPLMSFSSADIADMDREVEDIFNESESESENKRAANELEVKLMADSDEESSSSDESMTNDHPHGWSPESISRKRSREEVAQEHEDESTADESPSTKFRRGEELSSDLEFGQDSNSEGSVDAPDEIDDGEWNMMGAALEREFLSNN